MIAKSVLRSARNPARSATDHRIKRRKNKEIPNGTCTVGLAHRHGEPRVRNEPN